ncbi:MAG: ATP-binding protein [Methanobacteriota archaeon]
MNLDFLPFGKKKTQEKKAESLNMKEYEDKLIEYLTSPSMIIHHPKDVQINKYHQVICAINYPRLVDPGWLTRLIEINLDFDLAIHITPYSVDSTIKLLENEIKKQKTDLYALEISGKLIPQALVQQHQDTMALLNLVQEGTEKMFDMSLYLDVKAFTKEELEKSAKQVMSTMNSIMIIPKIPALEMLKAVKSTLPIAKDELKITRNITSSAAAACFPFAITSLEQHTSGILIGFNEINSIPIIIDPFELSNPNILVLGTSGGGKSFGIKLFIMRELMEGTDVNIIDPQAEYSELVNTFDGKVIRIAPDSTSVINPFDLLDQSLDEKKLSLLAFFRVLLGELTEAQAAILDEAIEHVYEDKGITQDPKTWSNTPPLLEDLYNEALPLTRSSKEMIYKPAWAIVNRTKPYVFGPMRFLNQHTRMDIDKKIVSFDIRDAPDVGKGVIMFSVLEYVYTQMKKSKTRKILVIDEAWTVLSAGEQAEYVLKIVKTCRKFNLGLILITQDVEDILTTRAGRAVLTNTATKLLLKQDVAVVDQIVDQFNLNTAEQRFLSIATMGRALLIAENTRIPIFIQASPEEYRLITTKPDEMINRPTQIIEKPSGDAIQTEFDLSKKVQNKALLSDEQIIFLEKRGFEEVRVVTLQGKSELFLIVNNSGETDDHFVLQQMIFEEVRSFTDQALIHHTKLPDVTFEAPDGRMIAIEVSAGVGTKAAVEEVKNKMKVLKKYDYFFIISDDISLQRDYQQKLGEILPRTDVPEKISSFF